ncbi:hypothetical protein FQA39_LY02970 [Lamprigera yunnana]|nr:hypothetical protein FQA39_LY02970 [Lamprigera yunnana]
MKKYNEVNDAARQQHPCCGKRQNGERKNMGYEEDNVWIGLYTWIRRSLQVRDVSEATVYVVTTLGSVNLEYFLWKASYS